jgi:hypothetical protein
MIKDIKVTSLYLDIGKNFYNFESVNPLKSPYFIDSNDAFIQSINLGN